MDRPVSNTLEDLVVESYGLKPSLSEDMAAADLIISHGGAGTLMEVLSMKKRCIAVVNSLLMDNHQSELVDTLTAGGHILSCNVPSELEHLVHEALSFEPTPFPVADEFAFVRHIERTFGVSVSV